MQHWSLRNAKDHLSRLVEAAQAAPQAITKRGRDAVVVVSKQEYERLLHRREPLTNFFARAGLDGVAIERVEGAMRDDECDM
ncbi:MAG TPA: type II toxin-antitoxin system Phd/YefM family antitoxin [Stellaceae bacterium]|nr:type II toxin-antitoxin system Phd/YefM family antitoxin [Stellaceae bacterium]